MGFKETFTADLNIDFYKEFYGVTGDEKQVREHFNTIGVEKHLIPNIDVYANILSQVLNFNINVYSSNMSLRFNNTLIKNNNKHTRIIQFVNHFYGTKDVEGQVKTANIYRLKNSSELYKYNHKWEDLYSKINSAFKFDIDYYLFMNKKTQDDVFQQWLTKDVFNGKHPNLKSYTQNDNLIVNLMRLITDNGIDLNYISSQYKSKINDAKINTLNDIEKPLFLFLNYGKKYGFFWNESERNTYINTNLNKFKEVNEKLKSQFYYNDKILQQIKQSNDLEFSENSKKMKSSLLSFKTLLVVVNKLTTKLDLIQKITNKTYISNFLKVNNIQEKNKGLFEILNFVINNFTKINDNAELNSMDLKIFAISFFYNAKKHEKLNLSKTEYISLIKTQTLDFLEKLFNEKNIEFLKESVVKDIEFIIEHKKIIKLVKVATQVSLLLSNVI